MLALFRLVRFRIFHDGFMCLCIANCNILLLRYARLIPRNFDATVLFHPAFSSASLTSFSSNTCTASLMLLLRYFFWCRTQLCTPISVDCIKLQKQFCATAWLSFRFPYESYSNTSMSHHFRQTFRNVLITLDCWILFQSNMYITLLKSEGFEYFWRKHSSVK